MINIRKSWKIMFTDWDNFTNFVSKLSKNQSKSLYIKSNAFRTANRNEYSAYFVISCITDSLWCMYVLPVWLPNLLCSMMANFVHSKCRNNVPNYVVYTIYNTYTTQLRCYIIGKLNLRSRYLLLPSFIIFTFRPVGAGGARVFMASPDFGWSVNPILSPGLELARVSRVPGTSGIFGQ